MFKALSLEEHEVDATTSLISDSDRGVLEKAIEQCTWEREMLPKLARHGDNYSPVCFGSGHGSRKRHHASPNAVASETSTSPVRAIHTSLPAAKHGGECIKSTLGRGGLKKWRMPQ